MTIDQLKERIEATCNKNGIFPERIYVDTIFNKDVRAAIYFQTNLFENNIVETKPNTNLLIEAVDLECRAIKARQSRATNGLDV